MEETSSWTRFLLIGAGLAVVLALVGPLSHRFGVLNVGPAFLLLLAGMVVAVLVLLGGLVMAVYSSRKDRPRNRNLSLVAVAVSLVPLAVVLPYLFAGASAPPINDVTTDTEDPPRFDRVVALRGDAANSLTYGADMEAPDELARIQEEAYPEIDSLRSDLGVEAAVARAEEVLEDHGHEVVNVAVDEEEGIVEAVASTFWFGFRDDVIVRVRAANGGSVVDLRSVSRVGQSDMGTNADRVREFLEAF